MPNRLDIFAQTRWEGVPQALWRSAQVRKRKLPIEHKCAPCCSPCTRARQSSRLPAWHSFRPSQAVEQEWSKILRARRQEDASIANHKSGDSARLACIVILPKEGRCSRGARGSKRLQEGAALARGPPVCHVVALSYDNMTTYDKQERGHTERCHMTTVALSYVVV